MIVTDVVPGARTLISNDGKEIVINFPAGTTRAQVVAYLEMEIIKAALAEGKRPEGALA